MDNKYRVKMSLRKDGRILCCSEMCSDKCIYANKCKTYEIEIKEADDEGMQTRPR